MATDCDGKLSKLLQFRDFRRTSRVPASATGRFCYDPAVAARSAAQAAADDRYGAAVWHIAEVWQGRDDGRWLYAENWFGEAERP